MYWILKDIATHLHSIGVGKLNSNLFIGDLPNSPIDAIGIYSSPGTLEQVVTKPAFQILIRKKSGSGFASAARLADYIFHVLDDKWDVLQTNKGRITASSTSGTNYRDDAGNWVFSLNFQAITVVTTLSTVTTHL
jgi:hypothetical protein